MSLSKNAILEADDCQPVKVLTPEWGGEGFVFVKAVGGDERDRFDQFQNAKRWPEKGDPDWSGIRANLVALGLCDQQGDPMGFTDLDIKVLGKKGAALERCFETIRELSGMTVKALEDAEKNLPETQTESCGSS